MTVGDLAGAVRLAYGAFGLSVAAVGGGWSAGVGLSGGPLALTHAAAAGSVAAGSGDTSTYSDTYGDVY